MKDAPELEADARSKRLRRRMDEDASEFDRELELQERSAGQVLKRAGSRTMEGFVGLRGAGQMLASLAATIAPAFAFASRVAAGPLSLEAVAAATLGGAVAGLASIAVFRAAKDVVSPPVPDDGFRLPLDGESFARACTGKDSPAERLARGEELSWAERRTAELHLGEIARRLPATPEKPLSAEAAQARTKAPMDFDAADAGALLAAAGRDGADAAAHAWDGKKIVWDPMNASGALQAARVPAGADPDAEPGEDGAAMLAAAAAACVVMSDISSPQP